MQSGSEVTGEQPPNWFLLHGKRIESQPIFFPVPEPKGTLHSCAITLKTYQSFDVFSTTREVFSALEWIKSKYF